VDTTDRQTGDGIVKVVLVSVLTDNGEVRSFDLHRLAGLKILDAALRRDLDYYLEDAAVGEEEGRADVHVLRRGQGERTVRLSYHAGGARVEGDLPDHPGRGRQSADDPGLGGGGQHAGRGLGGRASCR